MTIQSCTHTIKLFAYADRVVRRLGARGYSVLGKGMYSTVLVKGDSNRVIKVGTDTTWEPFIEWGIENGFAGSFTPRVYAFHQHRAGLFTATMERLDTTVSGCKQHPLVCEELLYFLRTPYEGANAEYLDKLFPGFTCFIKQALYAGFGSDLHGTNWMMQGLREDGTYKRLILIDPQSGRSSKGMRRWHPAGVACVST